MSELIKTDSTELAPSDINIETLKSVFDWLNEKPDTHIKVFPDPRIVTNDEIVDLNNKIQNKLSNHHTIASVTSIKISIEEGEIKSFSTWEAFRNHYWDIHEKLESIAIKWDILIKLPEYKFPQKHTLNVRIGSSLRPTEPLNIMAKGNDEINLKENISFVVCKVDFINVVLSKELISIVETWYKSLQKLDEKSKGHTTLKKRKTIIAQSGHYLTMLIGLTLFYIAFKIHLKYFEIETFNMKVYLDIVLWLIILILTYSIFKLIGSSFEQYAYKKIDNLENPHFFAITKGDKNKQIEIDRKNRKISSNLFWQFLIRLSVAIISLLISKYK